MQSINLLMRDLFNSRRGTQRRLFLRTRLRLAVATPFSFPEPHLSCSAEDLSRVFRPKSKIVHANAASPAIISSEFFETSRCSSSRASLNAMMSLPIVDPDQQIL